MAASLPIIAGESGLARYLQEIKRFPMLEPQEEYMLAKRWREHGDREAAHKLVTSHLRLVAKIAMGYRGYGLPIGEVISEGNVGLMQAVKRFEPDKGFKLATYAMWWIRASIQEYILRSWSLVKMGTTASQKKLFFNLRKAKSRISALDEGDLRDDQVETISKRLGVAKQDVIDMNRRLGGDASLNSPLREEGEGEWQDWLVDDSAEPGIAARRPRGIGRPPRRAEGRAFGAQPARAADFRGPPAGRRSDHARGAFGRIRRLARARAADRGPRLREGPGGGEGRRRQGAGAEARACGPAGALNQLERAGDSRRPDARARANCYRVRARRLSYPRGPSCSATVLRRRAAPARAAPRRRGAVAGPAFAADRPATPDGAESLQAFLDRFLPAPRRRTRARHVKPDGQNYVVSTDLAAMNGAS